MVHVNVLAASVDSGLLRRVLQHCRGDTAARCDGNPTVPSTAPALVAADNGPGAPRRRPRRSLKLRLAADCGHVSVLAEGTRLATVTWHHMEVPPPLAPLPPAGLPARLFTPRAFLPPT